MEAAYIQVIESKVKIWSRLLLICLTKNFSFSQFDNVHLFTAFKLQLSVWLCIFRDEAYKGGGYLTVEDASGYVQTSYLEDGFFDYLNKVTCGTR